MCTKPYQFSYIHGVAACGWCSKISEILNDLRSKNMSLFNFNSKSVSGKKSNLYS